MLHSVATRASDTAWDGTRSPRTEGNDSDQVVSLGRPGAIGTGVVVAYTVVSASPGEDARRSEPGLAQKVETRYSRNDFLAPPL